MYIHKQKDLHFLMAIHFFSSVEGRRKIELLCQGEGFFFPSKPSSRGNQYILLFLKYIILTISHVVDIQDVALNTNVCIKFV